VSWHARLALDYSYREGAGTLLRHRHEGPLRVLQSLYPEGPAVCHNVLVHPPGGLVGGDALEIDAHVGALAHALVTTPGATRFYRSAGASASQRLRLVVGDAARAEWLPLETICHPGALAETRIALDLAPRAETIGWDLLALGLPAAGAPFDAGRVTQHIELPGVWLERGRIDASDRRLLDSPLGWAGRRVLATLWFAAGSPLADARREALLDAARMAARDHPLGAHAGCTAPNARVVVLRALSPRVEPAWTLLVAVWRRWREVAWKLPASLPRVWAT
jgi:urease accessory protein